MKNENKSLTSITRFLERLGGILLEPRKTFYDMMQKGMSVIEPLFLIIVFFGIQGALFGVFTVRLLYSFLDFLSQFAGTEPLRIFQGSFIIITITTTISWIIAALLIWIISAGIAHLSAKYIFKGLGSYSQLLKLYGYASIPSSLVILGIMLLNLNLFIFFGIFLILCLIAFFWIVVILLVAVERCYLIDPGQAFISSFIVPLVVYLTLSAIIWSIFSSLLSGGLFL
ncbi:MAG: YIP1 family protein [Nitrososphaerales archaeon]